MIGGHPSLRAQSFLMFGVICNMPLGGNSRVHKHTEDKGEDNQTGQKEENDEV
jgi:hypothetical protein